MSDTIQIIIKVKDLASAALKDLKKSVQDVNQAIDGASAKDVDNFTVSVEESGTATEQLTDHVKKLIDIKPDGFIHSFGDVRDIILDINDAADQAFSSLKKVSDIGKDIVKNQAGKSLFGAGATKLAGNFSKAIGEVGTLVDTTQISTEELNNTVLDLSASYGVDKFDVASALYQGISAGAEAGTEANTLLETAIKGAIAGATDTETVIDGLTTVINSFGKEMSDAGDISDVMFATMKNGKTTIGDLSSFLFQAAPLSNTLGVSFEELNAAIIAITLQGTPTAQAMTGIRAALAAMIRPAGLAADAFDAAGYANGKSAIQAVGFAGALDIVTKAAKGDEGQLIAMLGSLEAVQAVLQTTGKNAHLFAGGMEAIENASGGTEAALEVMEGTLDSVLQKLQKSSNAVFTLFGSALGDTLRPLISLFTGFFRILADLIQEFPILTRIIVGFLAVLVSLKVAIGLVLIAGSAFAALALKLLIFRTVGTVIGVLTGNVASLKLAFDAVTLALVRLLGAARVAALKTALLTLGGAFLTLTANILTFLGLPSLAGFFTTGAAAAKKLGAATFTLAGVYNKITNIVPATIAAFIAMKASVVALGAAFLASSLIMKATFIGVIVAAGVAVYKLIGAISDYYDMQERLNRSIERQESIIRKLEKAGTREVEILGAEELLALNKEQIDAYQEQILMKLKLVDAEYVLARASGESKEVQDKIWERRTSILKILHSTYDREREILVVSKDQTKEVEKELSAKAKSLELSKQLAGISGNEAVIKRQNKETINALKFERKVIVDSNRAKSKALQEQLKNDEITVSAYWDAVNQLGLDSIAADKKVAEQKLINKQRVQELEFQELAIQEKQAVSGYTAGEEDDEIRIVKETYALKRKTLQEQQATDIDDLTNRIKELDHKESVLVAENNTRKIDGIKAHAKQTREAAEEAEEAESRRQQDLFDRELVAILARNAEKRKALEQDVQAGTINQFELGGEQDAVDADTLADLDALKLKTEEYNATVQDPNNVVAIQGLDVAIKELGENVGEVSEKIQAGLVSGLATAFEGLADGSKNAKEAFSDFANSFLRQILQMITQALALQAIKLAFGAFSGGGSAVSASGGGYIRAAEGGYAEAQGFAEGGFITGKGTTTSDSIPARLSDKEYVVQASAVEHYGVNFLEALNRMKLPVTGGLPSFKITRPRRANFASGGVVSGANNSEQKPPEVKLRVVNNIDPDLVDGYMNSREGEETLLNLISNNSDKINGILS